MAHDVDRAGHEIFFIRLINMATMSAQYFFILVAVLAFILRVLARLSQRGLRILRIKRIFIGFRR